MLGLFCRHHRVEQVLFLAFITTYATKSSGVVIGIFSNTLIDFIGMVGNDKQRLFLVALI